MTLEVGFADPFVHVHGAGPSYCSSPSLQEEGSDLSRSHPGRQPTCWKSGSRQEPSKAGSSGP
jgi:hypothetical protein